VQPCWEYCLVRHADVEPVLPANGGGGGGVGGSPGQGGGRGGGRSRGSGRGRGRGGGRNSGGGRGRGGSGGQEGRAAASLPAPWGAAAAAAAATPGGSLGGLPALRLGTPTEAEARAVMLAVCPTAPPSARLAKLLLAAPADLVAAAGSGQIAAAIAAAGPGVAFAPAAMYADVAVGWLAAGLEELIIEVDQCFAAGAVSAAGPLPVCHVRLCGPPAQPQPGALGGDATAGAAPEPGSQREERASRSRGPPVAPQPGAVGGGGPGGGGGRGRGRGGSLGGALDGGWPHPQQEQQQQPRPLVPPGRVALPLAGLKTLDVSGTGSDLYSLAVIDHALLDHLADAVGAWLCPGGPALGTRLGGCGNAAGFTACSGKCRDCGFWAMQLGPTAKGGVSATTAGTVAGPGIQGGKGLGEGSPTISRHPCLPNPTVNCRSHGCGVLNLPHPTAPTPLHPTPPYPPNTVRSAPLRRPRG
jgi:hypothetical protein